MCAFTHIILRYLFVASHVVEEVLLVIKGLKDVTEIIGRTDNSLQKKISEGIKASCVFSILYVVLVCS